MKFIRKLFSPSLARSVRRLRLDIALVLSAFMPTFVLRMVAGTPMIAGAAKNQVYEPGDHISAVCSAPTTPASGDPVLVGQIPGVALTDERADGTTTLTLQGIYNLSVKGENAAGNNAVAVGDILYYEAGQTPPINKDATNGVRFGYALGAVSSGATTTIPVLIGY